MVIRGYLLKMDRISKNKFLYRPSHSFLKMLFRMYPSFSTGSQAHCTLISTCKRRRQNFKKFLKLDGGIYQKWTA